MSIRNNKVEESFYTPEAVRPLYPEIVPVYQEAFAGPPWYEVSKCADTTLQRCAGGLSSRAIGEMCDTCGIEPTRQAYERDELVERFEAIARSRPTAWYIERNKEVGNITLAALAWKATPQEIAAEKYGDVPEMGEWLEDKLDTRPIIWLDEVFANRGDSPNGNLANFQTMVRGFGFDLRNRVVAYRTIAPQMTRAAQRDFNVRAKVMERNIEVPDRRDFVIIDAESWDDNWGRL